MYVAVPIQQGTHITDLFNILLLGYYCVSHIRITWLYQQKPFIIIILFKTKFAKLRLLILFKAFLITLMLYPKIRRLKDPALIQLL
jgi:hypothetical protein